MINFNVNQDTCTLCGLCAKDCPANIIAMTDNGPSIQTEKQELCYKCQHCLAICPTAAISILGVDPSQSRSLLGAYPSPEKMETLIKGRRSVRRYKDENLDPALIEHLLQVAWHAPTGKNERRVLLTVVDDKEKLAKLRGEALDGLDALATAGKLPAGMERFGNFSKLWKEKQIDILFRGAPHLVVASAPKDCASPQADCLIALSYFELFAQTQKIGTVWDGLFKWTTDLLPDLRQSLKIPAENLIGYAMAFGKPDVRYSRTVQHKPNIVRV